MPEFMQLWSMTTGGGWVASGMSRIECIGLLLFTVCLDVTSVSSRASGFWRCGLMDNSWTVVLEPLRGRWGLIGGF